MICPQCRRHFDATARHCAYDGATLVLEDPPPSARAEGELQAGDTVGDYQVQEKLGQGGMGVVYRAIQPVIGKKVAVKVLKRELASSPIEVARFVQEARAVNQIGHRNIIDIFTFGSLPDGRHFFVMELLDGVSLRKRMQDGPPLTHAEILRILRDIARALDAAHAAGIVHRDLKPDNIFLCRDETGTPTVVKLLDFGIAKLLEEDGEELLKTKTGVVMGTPYYMSPEQCRGRGIDHRSDIYALGVLAFLMFTGTVPFQGASFSDVMLKHVMEPPPLPSELSRSTPPVINAPLLRALEKDPERRYNRAGELVGALERALTGPASSDGETRPLPRPEPAQPVLEPSVSHLMETGDGLKTPGPTLAPPAGQPPEEEKAASAAPVRQRKRRAAKRIAPPATPESATPESTAANERRQSHPGSGWTVAAVAGVLLAVGAGAGWLALRDRPVSGGGTPLTYEIDPDWVEKSEAAKQEQAAAEIAPATQGVRLEDLVLPGPATGPKAGSSGRSRLDELLAPIGTGTGAKPGASTGAKPGASTGSGKLTPLIRPTGSSSGSGKLTPLIRPTGSSTGTPGTAGTASGASKGATAADVETPERRAARVQALLNESDTAYRQQQFAKARDLADQAQRLEPASTRALLMIGTSSCQLQDRPRAQWAHQRLPRREADMLAILCPGYGVSLP